MPSRSQGGARPAPAGALTVRELLARRVLTGAELLGGARGLDRPVLRLNVMTVPEIVEWVKDDEFLLATGYPLPSDAGELAGLVRGLRERGLAGLGVKLGRYLPELPAPAVAAADDVGLPLVVIPEAVAFDDILTDVFSTIVNRQATELAQAQQIHNALLQIVLRGGGVPALAGELAALLPGAAVAIADQSGRLLATAGPLAGFAAADLLRADGDGLDAARLAASTRARPGERGGPAVGVIRVGRLHHGFVVAVEGDTRLGSIVGTAVEQAALVAALEFTRDLAVAAVERQFASNALHDLVTSSPADTADVLARADGFGWDLDRPLAVLMCRPDEPTSPARRRALRDLAAQRVIEDWTALVRARDRGAAVAGFSTELVAVIGATGDPVGTARAVLTEMCSRTRRTFSIGVSRRADAPTDIPRGYAEARTALEVGVRVSGAGSVTAFGDLGLLRLLSLVDEAELHGFVEETLGPLLRVPPPERTDLIRTLEVLLERHLNVAESARVLHYHYNTLRYRIGKLERLLGPFTDDPRIALEIAVALQVLQMREFADRR